MNNKIYIGIDLHKRSQTWVALGESGNKLLTKTYPVTTEDINTAVTDFKQLGGNEYRGFVFLIKTR